MLGITVLDGWPDLPAERVRVTAPPSQRPLAVKPNTSSLSDPLEGSRCWDVPRPDAPASAGARNAGQGKRAATRTHAQPPLGGEHGEDGEHWTLTGVSTLAPLVPGAGLLRHLSARAAWPLGRLLPALQTCSTNVERVWRTRCRADSLAIRGSAPTGRAGTASGWRRSAPRWPRT